MYLELLEDQAAKEGLTNGIRGKKMDLDEYEKVRPPAGPLSVDRSMIADALPSSPAVGRGEARL